MFNPRYTISPWQLETQKVQLLLADEAGQHMIHTHTFTYLIPHCPYQLWRVLVLQQIQQSVYNDVR